VDTKFGAAKEELTLWRANFEEFIRYLRDKVRLTINFLFELHAIATHPPRFSFSCDFFFHFFLKETYIDSTNWESVSNIVKCCNGKYK
jgi:hypothetical protein